MSKPKKFRCRSKAGAVELLTNEIELSLKGKPKRAVLWTLLGPRNRLAKGSEPTRILALGLEQIANRE